MKSFCGLVWHVVVSGHDACAFYLNFLIDKTNSTVVQEFANGSGSVVSVIVGANYRGAFSHAVSLEYVYSVFFEFGNIHRIQICPSAEYIFQFTAKCFLGNQLFRKERVDVFEFFVNGFYHERNHQHADRLEPFHVFQHVEQRVIDADSGAQRNALHPFHCQAECVMYRQNAQNSYTRFQIYIYIFNILCEIELRQHDAFAFACCSRGIHKRTHFILILIGKCKVIRYGNFAAELFK